MKGNMKLGLVLALFAMVGCASLALVYAVTKPAIETQEKKALAESLKDIFPEAVEFEDISAGMSSGDPDVSFQSAFLVKGSLAPLGVAVKASGPSYGGKASLLVGVDLARAVQGVRVLELNDTPGLGANAKNTSYYVNKAEKLTFPAQFAGKHVTDDFEAKKDIIPITAATITSKALAKIVKTASIAASDWLEASAMAGVEPAGGEPPQAEGGADVTGGK